MELINKVKDFFFSKPQIIPSGMYHFQSPPDVNNTPYRLHLRVEKSGAGVLIINAKTILHLNATAVEYAYHLVKQTPPEEAINTIASRYRVSKAHISQDMAQFKEKIETLIFIPDLDPETYLDMGRQEPYAQKPTAPYRLDCALTYRHSEGHKPEFTPIERVKRELLTEEWQAIMAKAWNAGVPHVIFTGGEPTLRPDLPDLIAYSEGLGMVCGVLTDGFRLAETHYLHQLLEKGVDHFMIVLEPSNPTSWEGLRDALAEDVFITVHLTISSQNEIEIENLIDRLKEMGVKSISISAIRKDLSNSLRLAKQAAAERHMALTWDLPVPYSQIHPINLELSASEERAEGDTEPFYEGDGRGWLYVEPDGDVLAGQGRVDRNLGNLLTEPWETIWERD